MITTPKTKKAVRDISIPDFLYFDFMAYIKRVPGMKSTDRIFPVNSTYLNDAMLSMYKSTQKSDRSKSMISDIPMHQC